MSCHSHRGYSSQRTEAELMRRERTRQVWTAAWSGAVQGAVSGARGAPTPPSRVRIGDAERESAVAALGEHYAVGRLSKEEFDERSGAAWSARTSGDLAPLFTDLPALHQAAPRRPRPSRTAWRLGFGLWWVLVLLLVLAVADEVPWFAVAIFAGLWWTGMFGAFHRWAGRSHGASSR